MTIDTMRSDTSPVPAGALRALLAGLTSSVDELASLADPAAACRVEGAEAAIVVAEALALAGRLTAIAARAVTVVEADGWWALDARNRSITSWVAGQGRITHGQASRLVGLGRAMRDDLPATAVAAVDGTVSVEAAHVLASVATTEARRTALAAPAAECGEPFLLEHARVLPTPQFRLLARRWAAQADPEADERGYRDASEAEFLDLADTQHGCHLSGFLTTEHGHALRGALTAFLDRSASGAGRPAGHRRATALTTMVRTVLDNDLTGATGTHRPQISVVTDLTTLTRALTRGSSPDATSDGRTLEQGPSSPTHLVAGGAADAVARLAEPVGDAADAVARPAEPARDAAARRVAPAGDAADAVTGHAVQVSEPAMTLAGRRAPVGDVERFAVAELVGTGPVPDVVLARLACDSTITRVVFGPESQVLNVGRSERTYTGHKRRAIIARDLHCQAPGCHAPPALSEIHHTEHWARDQGSTDVATGCLLCWFHHTWVHDHHITVRRLGARWAFTDRDGHPLDTS